MVRRAVPSSSAPFVHLDVHSGHSLGAGVASVERLVARAAADGHRALALTDTDGAYALPHFQTCCDAVDLPPLCGAELHGDPARDGGGDARRARALVLAEDATGYAHLCRLIARRHRAEGQGADQPFLLADPERPFVLADHVPELARGLVVLTPSIGLLRALVDELGPPGGDRPFVGAEIVAHDPPAVRTALVAEARRLGCPVVGTHRVFLERPAQHEVHRTRLAIAHLAFLADIVPEAPGRDGHPIDLVPPTAWLMPPARAAAAFADLPEAARATLEVAERLTFRFERSPHPRLPSLDPTVLGLGDRDVTSAERREAAYGRLAARAIEGLRQRYARLTPEALARLEMELRVIQQRGFADYFLIVDELVRFAREQGIPSVGRGSAASSIVAYALGITSVDPLRHELPFERFLSPERRDCPDIDLDLDWRGRDAVIRHAYATYGEDRVAMIATHVTFQARAAVRDVARTRGLSPEVIGRVTAHLPHRLGGLLTGRTPPPELAGADLGTAPWRDVLRTALALDGLPRHLGLHVGGIVIGDGPLAEALPLERSAMGRIATQFEMHGVEATGLVKIDLLGNRALAVIADVARDIEAHGGRAPDLDAVPEDDEGAGALLRTGRTLGCFQVESPAMRNLVVRMDAHSQRDAMIALSLIRPGPAGSGMKDAYVRRRRGEEAVPAVHERVDPLFTGTYGVMLYQEDTLRVAASVAGFDMGQADRLRRALSKKREPADLPAMAAAFRDGAAARGVPAGVIEHVWSDIQRFSAYAYNKAHAATYARISWQGLHLKARQPASYLASVLRNAAGFYAPRVYVEEARRLGCFIAPPCVNASAEGPLGWERTLRLGLGQVKGLGQETPARLVQVREAGGPYVSLTDLLLRTDLTRAETERLVLAGALDVFDRPRGEVLWMLALDFERYAEARQEGRDRRTLFGPLALLPPRRDIPVPRQYTAEELLELEIETLGLTVTCHPSDPWQLAADEAGAVPLGDLSGHVGRTLRVAGWIVSDRRVRVRAPGRSTGRYMKFVMLEDATGSVEVTLFPRVYEQVGHRLTDAGPYLLTGRVRDDHGSLTFEARDVARLGAPGGDVHGIE